MKPPFRVEHVGSFVRPPGLLEAVRSHKAGSLNEKEFKEIQDQAIRGIVAFQESLGLAEGGYEPVADALFNRLKADVYCLEYDTARAGDFSPLRLVPAGKRVVLGLVRARTRPGSGARGPGIMGDKGRSGRGKHRNGESMKKHLAASIAASIALAGCISDRGFGPDDRQFTGKETGILLGAAGGAVLGAVAYKKNRSKGALVGAIGGGLAGGVVGTYMDNQRQDLEKNLAREVQSGVARIEKLPGNVVRVTMTNQTAFETDSAEIKPTFHSTMDKLADVVVRYGKTALTVVGHTDNTGSNDYNQKLSERRALSVAQYLEMRRVNGMRMATAGKGETQPVANNASDGGRQANRRVEIYLEPVVES